MQFYIIYMSIYNFKNDFIDSIKEIYTKYGFQYELKYFHKILEFPQFNDEKIEIKSIKLLGVNDRVSRFYDDYHEFIDNNQSLNNIYLIFLENYVKPIYGDKLIVQKTPNIRISFPDSTAIGKREDENVLDDIIGLHKDSDFGHHESEINFIIPITEMFETNSVYYEPYEESNLPKDEYLNLKLNTNEFFIGKFNKLLHFNKMNKTGFTRISLDFRIIPYDKYFENIAFFKDTKFELAKYYISI